VGSKRRREEETHLDVDGERRAAASEASGQNTAFGRSASVYVGQACIEGVDRAIQTSGAPKCESQVCTKDVNG
jgi:hypothetical protein